VIIEAYLSVINYTENFIFHLSSSTSYTDGIVGFISLVFNVLDHLMIRYFAFVVHIKEAYKGKAIPLQAWTGLEGSRRLRLSDFKTVGT